MKDFKKLQEMDRRARELAGLYAAEKERADSLAEELRAIRNQKLATMYAAEKKRADSLAEELRSFAKIREHYEHAKEKHPYFCDRITCLSKDGANTHLDIYRATLAAELKVNAVEAGTLLSCEYLEAIQAYTKETPAAAIEKCYDAIAVLLRVVDVLEGRQALGNPAKGENNGNER